MTGRTSTVVPVRGGKNRTFIISAVGRLRFPRNCVNALEGRQRSMAITAEAAHGMWRSVKGDRLGSGLSPFYFKSRVARASGLCRRSGVPTEALAGRKAGTDQGTAVTDRGRGNSRRFPPARAREGRFERRGRERLATLLALFF